MELSFDLSKEMPSCKSNMDLKQQPKESHNEYKIWIDTVVIPELINVLTPTQMKNFIAYGIKQL